MDLSAIPAIDQHAHNVLRAESAARLPLAAALTEADPSASQFADQSLCYRRSLRDVAELLGCPADEPSILAERQRLGLEELTRRCLAAAHLEMALLDDGYLADQVQPLAWHAQFVPVRRLLRIETVAEPILAQAASFDDFTQRFEAALDPPPPGVVGYKSIIAYRSGLGIQAHPLELLRARFDARKATVAPTRLGPLDKELLDFLLHTTLRIAARHGLPVQLHTGFGDTDLDLYAANPLGLRGVLEAFRHASVPIVLLHASYPYVREAGYLASVYPQVYLDCGLAVPLLSIAGMRSTLAMLLELAPTGKVMYSSDAHMIPEHFYLAAKWGRKLLGEVLEQAIRDGDLNATEAEQIAAGILHGHARTLYRLQD